MTQRELRFSCESSGEKGGAHKHTKCTHNKFKVSKKGGSPPSLEGEQNTPLINIPLINTPLINIPLLNTPLIDIPLINIHLIKTPLISSSIRAVWSPFLALVGQGGFWAHFHHVDTGS